MVLLPVTLVNKAVGQVLYKKFVDKKNDANYLVKFVFKNIMLLSSSLPVFIALYIFGSEIFAFVFGANWKLSGALAAIMSPYIFFSFIVSPLSYYFVAFDKNKQFTIINIIFLSALFISVNILDLITVKNFIQLYTVISMLYYFTVFIVIFNGLLNERRRKNVQLTKK
jgi:O-antigen/teichoic acid export membrane protein